MRKVRNVVSLLFLTLGLTGCVSIPEFDHDVLAPTDIALNLKCEIANALNDKNNGNAWLGGWNMGVTLSLSVFNKANATGDASVAIPLTPGIATPALALSLDTEATRTAVAAFRESLEELAQSDVCLREKREHWPILLHGDLGVSDWFERVSIAQDRAALNLTQIDYTVDFKIEKSLKPSSRWTLIPIGSNTLGANIGTDLRNRRVHSLKLVLTKRTKPTATRVVIVGDERSDPAEKARLRAELSRLQKERKELVNTITKKQQLLNAQPYIFDENAKKEIGANLDKLIEEKETKDRQISQTKRDLQRTPSRTRYIPADQDPNLDDAITRSLLNDIRRDLRIQGLPN